MTTALIYGYGQFWKTVKGTPRKGLGEIVSPFDSERRSQGTSYARLRPRCDGQPNPLAGRCQRFRRFVFRKCNDGRDECITDDDLQAGEWDLRFW